MGRSEGHDDSSFESCVRDLICYPSKTLHRARLCDVQTDATTGVYSITFNMDNIRNGIESCFMYEELCKGLENSEWLQSKMFGIRKHIQKMIEVQR